MNAVSTDPLSGADGGRATFGPVVSRGTALVIVFLAFLGAYATSFSWMLPVWLDHRSHYSHGLLVLGLVTYLLWQDRHRLPSVALTPVNFRRMALAMLAASSIWFAGATAGVRVPTALAALPVAWLAMAMVLGRGGLWRLAPHLALILSVIPIWQVLSPGLQFLATRVVNGVLQTLGLTIFMEGNTIVMPEITFEIVGGCSGLGFLLVAFTLGVYLALSHRLILRNACLLVLGFGAMAIFANWLRITLILLVGYYDGPGNPLVRDHLWFGWAIFAAVLFVGIFFLLPRLPRPEAAGSTERSAAPLPLPVVVALIAVITVLPLVKLTVDALGRWNAEMPALAAPGPESLYQEISPVAAWQPDYPQASRISMRAYVHGSPAATPSGPQAELSLFQAQYRNQTNHAEVIDADNDLVGAGWETAAKRRVETSLGGEPRSVNELLLADALGQRMVIWYWYRIGDAHVAAERRAKIEQVLQKLRLRPDAMLVAIAAQCADSGCDRARQGLREFSAALQL